MNIKTADGMESVASNSLGNTAVTLGAIGTGLGILNGGLGLFGNNGSMVKNNEPVVTRHELDLIIKSAYEFYFNDADAPVGKVWMYMTSMLY